MLPRNQIPELEQVQKVSVRKKRSKNRNLPFASGNARPTDSVEKDPITGEEVAFWHIKDVTALKSVKTA